MRIAKILILGNFVLIIDVKEVYMMVEVKRENLKEKLVKENLAKENLKSVKLSVREDKYKEYNIFFRK